MGSFLKALKLIILFGLLIYISGIAYLNSHEFIHKQIYARYDIQSQTSIDYRFLYGKTVPINPTEEVYNQCNDSCKMQHSLNDIMGYYLVIGIMTLWFLKLFSVAYNKTYRSKKIERYNKNLN